MALSSNPALDATETPRPELDIGGAFELRAAELVRSAERILADDDAAAALELRLAARRLRSALDLYRDDFSPRLYKRARKALKRLMRIEAREWDAHHELLSEAHAAAANEAEKAAIEHVLECVDSERASLREELLDELDDVSPARLAALLQRLADDASESGHPKRRGKRVFKQIRDAIEDALDALPDRSAVDAPESLRHAYAAIRELRHALEAIELSVSGVASLSAPVKDLEQALGSLHDRAELVGMLEEHRAQLARGSRHVLAEQLGHLIERLREQGRALADRSFGLVHRLDRERMATELRALLGLKPEQSNGDGSDVPRESGN